MKKIFFVLAAQLFYQFSWCQQDTTLLNEAVVTASKFPTKTDRTGKVVTIIDAEQLARAGARDLSQVLQQQAGIFIGGANSNPGKDKSIYLWGASTVNTLILVDGMPVYDPSGIGGNFDLRNLSIQQIERIEIVKGAQSTLYGSDAVAGVINIITKKASEAGTALQASAGFGSYGTWRTGLSLQHAKGKTDYTLSYSLLDSKGMDETVEKYDTGLRDRDGYRQQNVQAGIGTMIGSQWKTRGFFRFGDMKGSIDQGAYLDELDYTYTQKSWQAGWKNEISWRKGKLNLIYQYNRIQRLYIDDSIKSRNGFDTYSRGEYKGGEHMVDLYADQQVNQHFHLLAGADLRVSSTRQYYLSIPAYGPLNVLDTNTRQNSIYASFHYEGPKGLHTELGGRINFHNAYGDHAVYNINPSWQLNRNWKLFFNYSTSYRTPSLYQLYSEYGNKDLEPEKGSSIETGAQYHSGNKKWKLRTLIFQRKIANGIFFYFDPVNFDLKYINQDRQKDHGIEFELNYWASAKMTLSAHYVYVSGRINTRENGKDTSYDNLLRRPGHQASIGISWRLAKQWELNGNMSYTGKRNDAFYNSASFSTERLELPGYFLLDISLVYNLKKHPIHLFADGRNLSNSQYMEIAGFRTQGLNASLGLRWDLNKK